MPLQNGEHFLPCPLRSRTNGGYPPRLWENSDVLFARRKFFSISSI
jgi:hypothetical protein